MNGTESRMSDQRGTSRCRSIARCAAVTCVVAFASASLGPAPAPGGGDPQPACFTFIIVGTCQPGMHAPPGALDCGCGNPPTLFPKYVEQHPNIRECSAGTPGWTGCKATLVQAFYQEYACDPTHPCTPVPVGNPVNLGDPCNSVMWSGQNCP